MSELIVVAYDDIQRAEEVRDSLLELQRDYLIDLEDAVVVVRKQDGRVRLNQIHNLPAAGAISGGFWGALIGLLFLSPLVGAAIGATAGAVGGALADLGIDDEFMRSLGASLDPGSSALFVLVRKVTPERVLEHVAGSGGRVLRTSLSHDDEQVLRRALQGVLEGTPSDVASRP